MIFDSHRSVQTEGTFRFSNTVTATVHPCLAKPIFTELWRGFTFHCSSLKTQASKELICAVGSARRPDHSNAAYAINVEPTGFCVSAGNEKNLIAGFLTLMDAIQAVDADGETVLEIPCFTLRESPLIQNRMIHFCVFPETELLDLQKFIRICAALKYSHVILEFWGMLKYDCMKELSWEHSYTKEQIRPLIQEAHDLGLEIIPMFNQWGHASACRVMHGKHVVLDQNPALQTYFTEDGWCWDISKPKVRALLRQIRRELCELCGEGSYFHIGCDEAYNFAFTTENMDFICNFINEVSAEMKQLGRRVIAWGDMFLYRHPHYRSTEKYSCNAPSAEVETYLLAHLSRDVVVADWQYNAKETPVETAAVFQKAGFDTLLCPWDRSEANVHACLQTVKEQHLFGLMHTTWHTLSVGMPYLPIIAKNCFEDAGDYRRRQSRTHTAALLRKVCFANGCYQRTGWSKADVSDVY